MIRRKVALSLLMAVVTGAPLKLVAQSTPDRATTPTLALSSKDPRLQTALTEVLAEKSFRRLINRRSLSVALVDLSEPGAVRYAGVDDDRMRYAASLPKIAILLTVFEQIDRGKVRYTPALKQKMEAMIRVSSNQASTELIRLVGFDAIASTLRDPRYELYSRRRNGGLWVGRDYGGWIGTWRRDPIHNISHGATARQVARFFVMLDRGMLVNPSASAEMKGILSNPELHHKFVLGLEQAYPTSTIFRKSGTWKNWHADAALVERDGKRYVAVALLEGAAPQGVLSQLIVKLDELIQPRAMVGTVASPPAIMEPVELYE